MPDVTITPNFEGISWRDFYKIDTLIEAGSNAAKDVLPLIETLKWGNGN
jgi:predicted acylesterase/phospholipase RssA